MATPYQEFATLQILQRLRDRISSVINRLPVDQDYLLFVCSQEMQFIQAATTYLSVPLEVSNSLQQLIDTLNHNVAHRSVQLQPSNDVSITLSGDAGRPRLEISGNALQSLLDTNLPVGHLAALQGISRSTFYRRMKNYNMSGRKRYAIITDEDLDDQVRIIKTHMPNAGYRVVKGSLQARGFHVQWKRVMRSVQRVDGAGIIARMIQLRCIARRTYSVPAPLSLVHIDTNHKLIGFNIVIFAGIDGFSRKILYLDAANNNKAETAFRFFMDGVHRNGWPSRVRADQGVENVDIAQCMFSVRGTGRGSFIAGRSVHNQRVERLWRDLWQAVTWKYYTVLHNLEEEGFLNITNDLHVFTAHFVFLPRLQADLAFFMDSWNNHPISTEGNLTPQQLWSLGMFQTPVEEPDYAELQQFDPTEDAASNQEEGVVVPHIPCPLSREQLLILQQTVNPTDESDTFGRNIYLDVLRRVMAF